MKNYSLSLLTLLSTAVMFTSCSDDDDNVNVDNGGDPGEEIVDGGDDGAEDGDGDDGAQVVVGGAVYAMTNGDGQVEGVVQAANRIATYRRAENGELTFIESVNTGGNGGDFDGAEGLDPLISAYAITKTRDNSFILAVNAGSNTISALPINADFSLGEPQTQGTSADGPNSIDTYPAPEDMDGVNSLVLVTNISRSEFTALGEPFQRGTIDSFWLLDDGSFAPAGASVELTNRPSCVHISPDGDYAIVAAINVGAAGLDSDTGEVNSDEIVLFSIANGSLTRQDEATSTERDNAEGRNLPSAIGSQIVEGADGNLYAVVTEAREFQPNGAGPAFPALQDGSVSTWRIDGNTLVDVNLDVRSGEGNTGRTACWLDFTADESAFFVSNAIEAGLASYSFNNGEIALLNQIAAQGTGATGNVTDPVAAFGTTQGWIDMWISDDGEYLYQLYGLKGIIGVYRINGVELEFVEEITGDLPENNTQGIVAI